MTIGRDRAATSVWRTLADPLEARVLLIGAIVVAAVTGFAALAGEAREGEVGAVDRILLLALRPSHDPSIGLGPRWVMEMARDISALGGFTVLSLVTIFATVMLLIHSRRAQAAMFVAAVVFTQIFSEIIKHFVDRPRPALVPHLDLVYSSSFPSGHSTMSPVVYLTLAAILCAPPAPRSERAVLVGGAMVLAGAIGVSRVYLGVHWPTDVLAGWILGSLIALASSYGVRRFGVPQRRFGGLPLASGP